jgi:hypothetical protein
MSAANSRYAVLCFFPASVSVSYGTPGPTWPFGNLPIFLLRSVLGYANSYFCLPYLVSCTLAVLPMKFLQGMRRAFVHVFLQTFGA